MLAVERTLTIICVSLVTYQEATESIQKMISPCRANNQKMPIDWSTSKSEIGPLKTCGLLSSEGAG